MFRLRFKIQVLCSILFFSVFQLVFSKTETIGGLRAEMGYETDSLRLARIYVKLANLYQFRSLDSLGYFATSSYDLARKFKDREIEALSLLNLGIFYFEKGNPYQAYKKIEEGARLAREQRMQDFALELDIVNSIMLMKDGNLVRGKAQLKDVLNRIDLVKNDSVRAQIMVSYHLTTAIDLEISQLDDLSRQLRDLSTTHNLPNGTVLVDHALTNLKFYKNGMDSAKYLESISELRLRSQKAGLTQIVAFCNLDLARFWERDDSKKALKHYFEGLGLARNAGYEALEFGILKTMTVFLDKDVSNAELSNELKSRMLLLNNARANSNKDSGVEYLQFVRNENQLAVQEEQTKIARLWTFIMGLTALIVLLIAFFMFRQYRIKRNLAWKLATINKELQIKNTRLEENDDFHKKLISMMSHDLRQPFSLILMMSDGLIEEVDRAQIQTIMQEMKHSAAVSLQTIDGLLNWMRMQIMRVSVADTPVSLYSSVQKALAFSDRVRERKNIQVEIEVDQEIGVLASEEVLLFINRNIILNALNYTAVESQVKISTIFDEKTNCVKVQVSDQGDGLPEHVLAILFKKDKSQQDQPERQHGGAGISMIICDEMIQKMGGRIWAENNSDRGASFFYVLPSAPVTKSSANLVELN